MAAAFATIVGLGLWSVFLTSERNDAVATAAEQAAIVDALLQPGQAAIAPVADAEGRTVATVVARDDRMQVVADGLSTNDTSSSTYVVWGMREGVPSPIGTFDVVNDRMDLRPVGSDQTGLDDYSEYRISIEPGRQAPSAPDGGRRIRGGDQLSGQETVCPTGEVAASRDLRGAARTVRRRRGPQPARAGRRTPTGGGGSLPAAVSTTAIGWAWASSAASSSPWAW